jgi:serine-type D-Ala-D-Ala carboxypeptidase/endopeptidase (penicillin-binding protein 4)
MASEASFPAVHTLMIMPFSFSFNLRLLSRVVLLLCVAVVSGMPSARAESQADSADGAYHDLSQRLQRKIDDYDWGGGTVGVHVVDFRHGLTAYRYNADTALTPGSVAKVVTAAAALEGLGPDFQFSTELFIRGEVARGRLMGDLMIRGDGDPTITSFSGSDPSRIQALFRRWSGLVRKEGVARIEGGIWVDATAFDSVAYAAGWPAQNPVDPAIPEISALNLNDNSVEVFWTAGRKKNRIAAYELFPAIEDYLFLSNNVRVDAGGEDRRGYFRRPGLAVIAVEGRIPLRAKAHDRVTVPNPPLFFGHAVKTHLARQGVEVVGGVAPWETADVSVRESRGLRRIDLHRSAPLSEILPAMLARDRTLDAEVIFKALGRAGSDDPGRFEHGSGALTRILSRWGMSTSGVVFVDGSGVSSFNRIDPRRLMGVFDAAHRSPWRRHFEAALPRLRLDAAVRSAAALDSSSLAQPEPVAYGLTGSFPGGQTAAGWAETRSRAPLHFVVMVDGSRLPSPLLSTQVEVLIREIAATWVP